MGTFTRSYTGPIGTYEGEAEINKIYDRVPDATLICSIILAYFLNRYCPILKIDSLPVMLIGWLVIGVGLGMAINIIAMLKTERTSTDPTGVPSRFITNGLYSLSRNPFYLLYVIVAIGAALALGSLTAFAAPIICFAVLNFFVIPVEEKNLQKKFSQEYAQYKHTVRRWI